MYSLVIQRITRKNCLGIIFLENLISETQKNVFGINFAISTVHQSSECSRSFPDLFSRVRFSFLPFLLATPLPPFLAPSHPFLPSKNALFGRARWEGQFQDGPLHKVREGFFLKSARKQGSFSKFVATSRSGTPWRWPPWRPPSESLLGCRELHWGQRAPENH